MLKTELTKAREADKPQLRLNLARRHRQRKLPKPLQFSGQQATDGGVLSVPVMPG